MKTKGFKAAATAAVSVAAILIISLSAFPAGTSENVGAETENSPAYQYIIKEYNGKVAVFTANSDEPFKITERSISELTEGDRDILKKGIPVYTSAELNKRLEDYDL